MKFTLPPSAASISSLHASGSAGATNQTLLQRTGADYEIDLAVTVTPLGSRLEHPPGGLEEERERYRQRWEECKRRLSSYQSRQGGAFAFADELAEKRRKLREVEEDWRNRPDDAEAEKIAA